MDTADSKTPVIEAVTVEVASGWNRHERILLNDVNWTVAQGESWVIGGPHGSGKTDFLMTVAGLHRPAAGTVRIFGHDLSRLPEAELLRQRTKIGFVFKGGGRMFLELTVAENLALPLCYHHNWTVEEAAPDVNAMLDLADLTALADETAMTLRADLQQRVGLARALALKPDVLFLDEPAAGLEPHHRQWWQRLLAQMSAGEGPFNGRRMTLIAATNDFSLWRGGKHRFAVIKDGHWQVADEQKDFPNIE